MKVKLLTTMAGPQGTWIAGSVVDLPETQARELIVGGYAEPVKQPAAPVETATLPEDETTLQPEQPSKGGSKVRRKS